MLNLIFNRLINLLFAVAIAVLLVFPLSSPAYGATSYMAALPGIDGLFRGNIPNYLGVHNRQLTPCPDSPNCVVSQNGDQTHRIDPIGYQGDRKSVRASLLKVLSVVPRTTIIEQSDNYIRVEFTSRLLGFVDDGEFYFPADSKVIHLRSASRLGESDLGVNRRRLEQIRLALEDLGI